MIQFNVSLKMFTIILSDLSVFNMYYKLLFIKLYQSHALINFIVFQRTVVINIVKSIRKTIPNIKVYKNYNNIT